MLLKRCAAKVLIVLLVHFIALSGTQAEEIFFAKSIHNLDQQHFLLGASTLENNAKSITLITLDKALNSTRSVKFTTSKKALLMADLLRTPSNKFIIVGTVLDNNSSHIRVIKTDTKGKTLWDNSLALDKNVTMDSFFYTPMFQTEENNFYIMTSTNSLRPDRDGLLYKIDKNGRKIWEKPFGTVVNDYPVQLLPAQEEGCLVLFWAKKNMPEGKIINSYLQLFDKNGNKVWIKGIYKNRPNDVYITSIVKAEDNAFILSGIYYKEEKELPYLRKISSTGETIWEITETTIKTDATYALLVNLKKQYFAFGMTTNNKLLIAIKFDENGKVVKTRDYKTINVVVMKVMTLANNNILVMGLMKNRDKATIIKIIQLDKDLNIVWKKNLISKGNIYGNIMSTNKKNGDIILGYNYIRNNEEVKVRMLFLDKNGNILQESDI